MSITKDFESRLLPIEHSTVYGKDETEALLEHARALEAMLRKHEWEPDAEDVTIKRCPECGRAYDYPFKDMRHFKTCHLAKLLE